MIDLETRAQQAARRRVRVEGGDPDSQCEQWRVEMYVQEARVYIEAVHQDIYWEGWQDRHDEEDVA